MRAFLAFEVSQPVEESIAAAQMELRGTGADLSIVAKENLHFTVKFLGDVPDDTPEVVAQRLSGLGVTAFEVMVKGLGVFPDLKRPRVVWAGVTEDDRPKVTRAANEFIGRLDGVGKDDEREFQPHITLGRVRSPRNVESLSQFIRSNAQREFGVTRVTSLKLKSSQLTPKGALYSDVREYRLS